MNIEDKVYIIDTLGKYRDYDLTNRIATIVNIYGLDKNYALRVDGIKNKASKDGLFYLKKQCVTKFECKYVIYDGVIDSKQLFIDQIIKNAINIKKVIFNKPATIVIWSDNTKTVVKRQKGDRWNKEMGLAMCIIKRLFGNTGKYYEIFKRYCNE